MRLGQLSRLGALAVCAALAGCGDGGGGDGRAAGGEPRPAADAADGGGSGGAVSQRKTVDPATAGSIAGTVTVAGDVPEPRFLEMIGERWCMEQHEGGGYTDDRLIVHDGRLANAFVWISAGLDDYAFDVPDAAVELDQQECLFVPRVVGVRAGQELSALNSDQVTHNVHTKPDRNPPKNYGMPPGSDPRSLTMRRQEVMVPVVCDIHGWMKAYVGVVDHPFFATTGADGTFRLEGVPPGSYTLSVWHEQLGQRELPVTVEASSAAEVGEIAFSF